MSMARAGCFLASFLVFLLSASPSISFEDSGELVMAASGLGVTHPPGYPWWTMLARLWMTLPVGDPAFRVNLMSATWGAIAVTAVFSLARRLAVVAGTTGWRSSAAPWVAASAFMSSRTLWWQAGIAEKYTMSVALMLIAVYAIAGAWAAHRRSDARSAGRHAMLGAFLSGLALSHHLHGLYLGPLMATLLWSLHDGLAGWRRPGVLRRLALCVFLAAAPTLAKSLALPIRASADPAMNWGMPDTVQRLHWYLSARQYRFIMGSNRGVIDVARRTGRHAAVLPVEEFGPVVALAAPGLLLLRASGPGWLAGCALVLGTNLFFGVYYNTPEIERYYLLSYALLAALVGLGFARIPAATTAGRAVIAVSAFALLVPWGINGRHSPRYRHHLAWDFAVNQLGPLPRGAILICEGDDQAFPMFYAQSVAGYRRDVFILPMPFACWEPSYRSLVARHPVIHWPPFVANPGQHLPRILLANRERASFYTPGCSGEGSASHLVPRGVVFAAFADPAAAAVARSAHPRPPALRLRGAVTAPAYRDAVTVRAVRNYGFAFAYAGAQALEHGDVSGAGRLLGTALRLPMEPRARAAALTHRGMAFSSEVRFAEAEPLLREALALDPEFSPAAFELARLLIVARRGLDEARTLLAVSARRPELLTGAQRAQLAGALGRR